MSDDKSDAQREREVDRRRINEELDKQRSRAEAEQAKKDRRGD